MQRSSCWICRGLLRARPRAKVGARGRLAGQAAASRLWTAAMGGGLVGQPPCCLRGGHASHLRCLKPSTALHLSTSIADPAAAAAAAPHAYRPRSPGDRCVQVCGPAADGAGCGEATLPSRDPHTRVGVGECVCGGVHCSWYCLVPGRLVLNVSSHFSAPYWWLAVPLAALLCPPAHPTHPHTCLCRCCLLRTCCPAP
jgi:hypothetical protein